MRMVVLVSRIATMTITPASMAVAAVARLSTANTGSKIWRWSTTSSTPSRPDSTSETTLYFSGFLSRNHSESCMSAAVSVRPWYSPFGYCLVNDCL